MSRARKGGGTGGPVPSVADAIRMNLATFERTTAEGDIDTARRCVDAAQGLFAGLRLAHGMPGGDEGDGDSDDTPLPRLAVATPSREPTHEDIVAWLKRATDAPVPAPPIDYDEIERRVRAAMADLLPLRPPPPSDLRLLACLTWQWYVCLGRLVWFSVQYLVRGRKT